MSAATLVAQVAPEKQQGMPGVAPPGLVIEQPHVTFPDDYQGALLQHRFEFRNASAKPVLVQSGLAISGTGTVRFEPALVAPGARGAAYVTQPLQGLGRASFRFALITDEPGVARYRMSLSGFIQSAYDPEVARLDFGQLERGQTGQATLELFSREVDALRVLRISGAPAYLDVRADARAGLADEGVRVHATLRPGAPLGVTSGTLRLETNVGAQPFYELAYTLRIFGDVQPSEQPIAFGLLRAGQEASGEVLLRSRSGVAVSVLSAQDPSGVVEAHSQPCGSGCARLVLTAYTETTGSLEGTLDVRLAGSDEPLPLRYVGWVVAPQTEVRTLDFAPPGLDLATPTTSSSERVLASPSLPSVAGPTPTPPAEPREPAPLPRPASEVRLEWKARNDREAQGYLVYRSEHPEGPFRRVSATMVPVSDTDAAVHEYVFVDKAVQAGRAYHYYLDLVGIDGRKRRFSGVQTRQVAGAPDHGRRPK